MRIGKLSKLSGVSQRMIRYYEEQGLLMPMRSESNYREYAKEDVCRLGRIQILQDAGLTLKIIHNLLPCINVEPIGFEKCPFVLTTLLFEKKKMEKRIQILAESLKMLGGYISDVEEGILNFPTAESHLMIQNDYPLPITFPQERGRSRKSNNSSTN